jgi:hypothetical protein
VSSSSEVMIIWTFSPHPADVAACETIPEISAMAESRLFLYLRYSSDSSANTQSW